MSNINKTLKKMIDYCASMEITDGRSAVKHDNLIAEATSALNQAEQGWDIPDTEAIRRGAMLADVLHLPKIRSGREEERYRTRWGTKTPLGLYLTLKRITEKGA